MNIVLLIYGSTILISFITGIFVTIYNKKHNINVLPVEDNNEHIDSITEQKAEQISIINNQKGFLLNEEEDIEYLEIDEDTNIYEIPKCENTYYDLPVIIKVIDVEQTSGAS